MVEVLPFPWCTLLRLQTAANSRVVNARTQGQEEAISLIIEELAVGEVPTNAETMERHYRTLSANRAGKYRHRTMLARQVAYEHQVRHVDHGPTEVIALQQVTTLLSEELTSQDWELLREIGDGTSYSEVGRKLGVPVGTVKARVSRLRRHMRNTEVAKIIRQTFAVA
jgi:DNA-binding NarL/FixJ family response regulator